MKRKHGIQTGALAGALALVVIAGAPPATARAGWRANPAAVPVFPAPPAPKMRAGELCLWTGGGFRGESWCWNPGNGYLHVPSALHDNVGSFASDVEGCFINWIHPPDIKETRAVRRGQFSRFYTSDFGGKIDAVAPVC